MDGIYQCIQTNTNLQSWKIAALLYFFKIKGLNMEVCYEHANNLNFITLLLSSIFLFCPSKPFKHFFYIIINLLRLVLMIGVGIFTILAKRLFRFLICQFIKENGIFVSKDVFHLLQANCCDVLGLFRK